MNKILSIGILLLSGTLFAQNNAPVVSNVSIAGRADCSFIVDIYYDLYDQDGDPMTVTIQVSNDNGATWNYSFSAANAVGDRGAGITSGTGKHIEWNFGADHPNVQVSNLKVKITADDGYIAGSGLPCPGLPSFTYGGQTYNTVQIGTQCWMRENLNIGTKVNSVATSSLHSDVSNNGIIEKYCYNNSASNCAIYGGLYEWNEMMGYATTPGGQGICPAGWHIPIADEWTTLNVYLIANGYNYDGTTTGQKNAKAMASASGWYSSSTTGAVGNTDYPTYRNKSGFTALGTGVRHYDGNLKDLTKSTYFWSSSEHPNSPSTNAISRFLYSDGVRLATFGDLKANGFSVRCLRD